MTQAIVFVDDDKALLDSLRMQVGGLYPEMRCEAAEDATEAWEVIDELAGEGVTILVVVSDWLMPGVRGDELLLAIKRKFPSIHCVLLTGQAPETAERRLVETRTVHRILHKPWSEAQLRETIDSIRV